MYDYINGNSVVCLYATDVIIGNVITGKVHFAFNINRNEKIKKNKNPYHGVNYLTGPKYKCNPHSFNTQRDLLVHIQSILKQYKYIYYSQPDIDMDVLNHIQKDTMPMELINMSSVRDKNTCTYLHSVNDPCFGECIHSASSILAYFIKYAPYPLVFSKDINTLLSSELKPLPVSTASLQQKHTLMRKSILNSDTKPLKISPICTEVSVVSKGQTHSKDKYDIKLPYNQSYRLSINRNVLSHSFIYQQYNKYKKCILKQTEQPIQAHTELAHNRSKMKSTQEKRCNSSGHTLCKPTNSSQMADINLFESLLSQCPIELHDLYTTFIKHKTKNNNTDTLLYSLSKIIADFTFLRHKLLEQHMQIKPQTIHIV